MCSTAVGIVRCTVIAGGGGSIGAVQRCRHWTDRSKGALWMKRVAGVMAVREGMYYLYPAY